MTQPFQNATLAPEDRARDLLKQLTPEEKIAQLCGVIFPFGKFPVKLDSDGKLLPDSSYTKATAQGLGGVAYVAMSLLPEENVAYANALQRHILETTRLRIPLFLFEEAMSGTVAYGATQFSTPIALAASFDPELVRRVFHVIGRETRVRGGNMTLTPVCDLGRDSRWGRVQETFGEDTHLASRMVVAAVRGLQGGEQLQPTHVAATLKHFAAFGQSIGGRQCATVEMGPQTLRNEILPPFRAGVQEGNVSAVMPAYPEIDGVPCHANRELLTDILRGEWGFAGLTVADFGGVNQLHNLHHVAADDVQAARMALLAGVDMDLPEGRSYPHLLATLATDADVRERVDETVRRVLTLKFRLGLFENPYTDEREAVEIVNCDAHHQLSIEAGQRNAVLLQNHNDRLPLNAGSLRRVAVIGPHARLPHLGPDRKGTNTIFDGLQKRLGPAVELRWAHGCRLTSKDGEQKAYLQETGQVEFSKLHGDRMKAEMDKLFADDRPQMIPPHLEQPLIAEAAAVARECDVAIVCLGESPHCIGEDYGGNCRRDRDSIELIGNQIELLRAVKAAGKPVIVLLAHTRALVIGPVVELADAILDLWDSGEARGDVAASVLLGDAEPGGRLPVTVPLTFALE